MSAGSGATAAVLASVASSQYAASSSSSSLASLGSLLDASEYMLSMSSLLGADPAASLLLSLADGVVGAACGAVSAAVSGAARRRRLLIANSASILAAACLNASLDSGHCSHARISLIFCCASLELWRAGLVDMCGRDGDRGLWYKCEKKRSCI